MNSPRISVCMIVKNEAGNIARSLRSIHAWADEIIIVDTGSSDDTLAIAADFPTQLYHYQWSDDFSAARNFSLQQASGEWILWLDADEEVQCDDIEQLHQLLLQDETQLFYAHHINYMGDALSTHEAYTTSQIRLLRNRQGFQFKYRIHEMLNIEDILTTEQLENITAVPLTIHHYGYLNGDKQLEKHERNLQLLQRISAEQEEHPWLEYHLASEYYRLQRYEQAFEAVNQSIVKFIQRGQLPPSNLYQLKYATILATGSIEGAWPGIDKAIELYPDYVDLYFYKGIVFYLRGWYEQAFAVFEQCLQLGDTATATATATSANVTSANVTSANVTSASAPTSTFTRHLTRKGCGSFLSLYYQGLILEKSGALEQAKQYMQQAIAVAGSFPSAAVVLRRLNRHSNASPTEGGESS